MEQQVKKVPLLDDDGNELLDDNGNPLFEDSLPTAPATTPVSTEKPVLTMGSGNSLLERLATGQSQEKGALSRIWDAISTPLTEAPSRLADNISNYITTPELDDSALMAKMKGFTGGAIEGVGDLVSSLTSPVDLVAAGLSGGSSIAARQGMKTPARLMNIGSRLASAPVAAHGAATIAGAEDLGDVGTGLVELAGGAAGMAQPPIPRGSASAKILEPIGESVPQNADFFESVLPSGDTPIDRNSDFFSKNKVDPNNPQGLSTPPAGMRYDEFGVLQQITPPPSKPKTIFIKPTPNAVADMKKATEAGYTHAGLDEKGRVKMVFTGEPKKVGLLETEVKNTRARAGGGSKGPEEPSTFQEIINFPRAIMASSDLSAPLRQGLPLIHRKEFWTSLDDMFRAWGSEQAFDDIMKDIRSRPLFKKRVGADGKELPSFAEDAGLKLSDLGHGLTSREESLQSTWAELVPLVRRSNRAYTAFLNKLRADTFESLIDQAKIFSPENKANVALAKEIGNFVNTASGRGSLGALESSAKALNATLFAPRLIASRLQMLNPHYYWSADPFVRKQALKSLLAVVGTGTALGQLGKMAGATVEENPTSADFGKIKIGDTRLDPFAGFQQYAVLTSRLLKGEVESTTTGNTYELGGKFGRPTRLDMIGRFIEGKANPIISFVTGLLRGKDFVGKPFDVPEELASRLIPIYLQDLKEILTENPNLVPFYHDEGLAPEGFKPENLPLAIPPAFGMGMQNYGTMK